MPDKVNSVEFGNLIFYYDPFVKAGILNREDIEKEMEKFGASMEDASAVYAAILNLLRLRKLNFEAKEIIFYGEMTPELKEIFEEARKVLFTKGFNIPSKLGQGPDKNHSYHQNIEGGKNMWGSLYIMREELPKPKYLVEDSNTLDILLKAQTIGTVDSLIEEGRKVLLLVIKNTEEETISDIAEFFKKTEEYLKRFGLLESSYSSGSVKNGKFGSRASSAVKHGGINLGEIGLDTLPTSSPITSPVFDPKNFIGFEIERLQIRPMDIYQFLGMERR